MQFILDGLKEAFRLIFFLDGEVYKAVFLSLRVSSVSTVLATLVGIPVGFWIAINKFKGKRVLMVILNTLYSLPTVIVGLFVYSIISRQGPLGSLDLLFTPGAMIVGQFVLILPLVTALSVSATQSIDDRVMKTALTLGASFKQSALATFLEGRFSYLAAILAGFGRAFGEIGVSMMLGGNIRGYTRNITTSIALETGKGEFALGIALGLILLAVALIISIAFQLLQGSAQKTNL